jgi:TolB protein
MKCDRRQLAAALVIGVLMVVAACGTPDESLGPEESSTGASPEGRILFVSNHDVTLWDGDLRQITDDVTAASPTWAPDGTRFAYVQRHDNEGYSDLFVAGLDGETLRQVTTNAPDIEPYSMDFVCNASYAIDPIWSPAGEQIIWSSDRGGWDWSDECVNRLSDPMFLWYSETWEADPYILQAAVDLGVAQENPTLSPDGNTVAFVARIEEQTTLRNTEVWTLDLNTAQSNPLVVHPDGAYDPAWSPDGRNIAYIQRDGDSNDVWIAPADGSPTYRLTSIGTCVSPVWSPDGRFIAFFRERDGNFEAWYVELTDDGQGHLTPSEPQRLFNADNIDTTSGMSWID